MSVFKVSYFIGTTSFQDTINVDGSLDLIDGATKAIAKVKNLIPKATDFSATKLK